MAAMHPWSHVAADGLMEPVEELLLLSKRLPLYEDEDDDEW